LTINNYHEEEALGKAYDARLMKRLLKYARPYRVGLIGSVILLIGGSVMQLFLPIIMQIAIDDHLMTGDVEGMGRMALIYGGILITSFALSYLQLYITMLIGQKVQYDIRMEIFCHLQKLHMRFFDKNPIGRLVTRVTNDVGVLDEMFSSGLVSIFGDIITLIGIVIALLYYNWSLALLTFAVLPLLVIATAIFRRKARQAFRDVRTRLARLNAFMQEHINGMTIIQLFSRQKKVLGTYSSINADLREANFRSVYYHATFFPVVEIISALSMAILLYYGSLQIILTALTFGELVAFIQLVQRFYFPIRDLAEKYNILQSSMASSERIFRLLDTKPEMALNEESGTIGKLSDSIKFDKVWFAYNGDDFVLRDVSFDVKLGEKVAIVGATGAGKTSLISLLYRFYENQKGSIQIDGIDIKNIPAGDLRRRMSLVLQDVFIFSGDYAGNIRLGNEDISDEKIKEALRRVNLYDFVMKNGDGLYSEVKERGATLSTGQKQLLSFARALAYNPDILVLDEATSSVDTATERIIQKALDNLLENRTAIIIAHRLSTIEKADKIIVMHNGQVREIGKHKELMDRKGIYYRLYLMQFGHDKLKEAV
jgi:ATP-binding cassette subfamily B multidrug efflux pump